MNKAILKDIYRGREGGKLPATDALLVEIWQDKQDGWVQRLAVHCTEELDKLQKGHIDRKDSPEFTKKWLGVCIVHLQEWVNKLDASVLAGIQQLAFDRVRGANSKPAKHVK